MSKTATGRPCERPREREGVKYALPERASLAPECPQVAPRSAPALGRGVATRAHFASGEILRRDARIVSYTFTFERTRVRTEWDRWLETPLLETHTPQRAPSRNVASGTVVRERGVSRTPLTAAVKVYKRVL